MNIFTAKEVRHAADAYIDELLESAITYQAEPGALYDEDPSLSRQLTKHAKDAVRSLIEATNSMGQDAIDFVQEDLELAVVLMARDQNEVDHGFGDADQPILEKWASSLPCVGLYLDDYNRLWAE